MNQRYTLEKNIKKNLESNNQKPINFNFFDPIDIVIILKKFVYNLNYQNQEIPLIFPDTSISVPFPVGCLSSEKLPKNLEKLPLIRLGLMSLHYPELDYLIDLYVTQNSSFERESSDAEKEEYTFHQTVKLLSDSILHQGGILEMYHTTNLQPLVIGFYRGIVKVIQERIKQGLPRSLANPKGHPAMHWDDAARGPTPPLV